MVFLCSEKRFLSGVCHYRSMHANGWPTDDFAACDINHASTLCQKKESCGTLNSQCYCGTSFCESKAHFFGCMKSIDEYY